MSCPDRMGEAVGRSNARTGGGQHGTHIAEGRTRCRHPCHGVGGHRAPGPAEPVSLTADEATALSSGNAAIGDWSGTPCRQYFAPDGTTVHHAEGAPPDTGRWRVDAETGAHESLWRTGGWSRYDVAGDGDRYLRVVHGSAEAQAFTVVEGRQLTP